MKELLQVGLTGHVTIPSEKRFLASRRGSIIRPSLIHLCLLGLSFCPKARAERADPYTYIVANNQATITAFTPIDDNPRMVTNTHQGRTIISAIRDTSFCPQYVLPLSITNTLGGCPVTSIGEKAFNYVNPPSLTIPDTVVTIGEWNFVFCSSLTNLIIGTGVTTIGTCSFMHCKRLVDLVLPSKLTNIANQAFGFCTSLTNITIPASVTKIGNGAFSHCPNLRSAYFIGNAPIDEGGCFLADPELTIFYIPNTTGWGPTFSGHPTALWKRE